MNSRVFIRGRRGFSPIEVVLFISGTFTIAMILYWLAQDAYIGLYQLISRHCGAPYL
jgi:hypothetical protein